MDIKLNLLIYSQMLGSLSSAEAEAVVTLNNLPETTCQSVVLDKYKSRLELVHSLLQQYKELVRRDVIALQDVSSNYIHWDALTGASFNAQD